MPNRFKSWNWTQETIVDQKGNLIGVLKIKPSGVLWKPNGAKKFFHVPLNKFTTWITRPSTKATLKNK